MPDIQIRFRHNPSTGKREIIISYESESDALPHEHERDHRALVEQLLGIPIDDEDILVERVNKTPKNSEGQQENEEIKRVPEKEQHRE